MALLGKLLRRVRAGEQCSPLSGNAFDAPESITGHRGYAGPRPIPGHARHHYRFQVLAIDTPIPDSVTTAKALLATMPGHVLARGMLTGTYERG